MPDEEPVAGGQPGDEPPPPPEPWFARRREVHALLYKVNRRPYEQPSLFEVDNVQPPNVLDHIVEVLLFGEAVETGVTSKRTWLLGSREIDPDSGTLAGQVGYTSELQHAADRFDSETKEWTSAVEDTSNSARAPFVFDASTGRLAIMHAPGFTEKVLPTVFRTLLNRGERGRSAPSTEWDVEPLMDATDFVTWLRNADAVESVTFVAKLPNPTGREAFSPVWDRLEERKAKAITEKMEARNREEGLQGVAEDEQARAYIAMASSGLGYVKGKRRRQGKTEKFDQRSRVRKRSLPSLPSDWDDAKERLRTLIVGLPPEGDQDAEG